MLLWHSNEVEQSSWYTTMLPPDCLINCNLTCVQGKRKIVDCGLTCSTLTSMHLTLCVLSSGAQSATKNSSIDVHLIDLECYSLFTIQCVVFVGIIQI